MSRLLAVEGLTWTPFGGTEPVLRDVAFSVASGEIVLVTGPSGSGKSSLLRCLVGFESFTGELTWRGAPVDSMREHRQRAVYLLQRPVPIAETIGENLAFPREISPEAWSAERQRDALRRLGVREWDADERFDRLSGGEQQRVALVRAMSLEPTLLLLDEPTASLDDDSIDTVEELLFDWLAEAERALVWVSHDEQRLERLLERPGARRFELGESRDG